MSRIKNYWESIPGWFDFQDIYWMAVNLAKPSDILVEVGSFLGKSTSFMMEQIFLQNKNVKFFSVDLFDIQFMIEEDNGSPEKNTLPWGETVKSWVDKGGKDVMYDEFLKNMENSSYREFLTGIIRERSDLAADHFKNLELSFVFIDAGHSYDNVMKDMNAWWPKIKYGGVFAGHDYISGEGVRNAVHDFMKAHSNLRLHISNASWVIFDPLANI